MTKHHRKNHRGGVKHHVHRIVKAVKTALGMDKPSRQQRMLDAFTVEFERLRGDSAPRRHRRQKARAEAARQLGRMPNQRKMQMVEVQHAG